MGKEKQITADQHFVPKFYLKRFANQAKQLEVYDCHNERFGKSRHYSSVCYEKFFYARETGIPDDISQEMEKAYQQMENQLSKIMEVVIPRIENYEEIKEDERLAIATLMSMMWLRGPSMRRQINRMTEHSYKKIASWTVTKKSIDELADKHQEETGDVISEEDRKTILDVYKNGSLEVISSNAQHLRFQAEIEGFRNLFFGKKWNVYLAKGDYKFITSDNPIAEYYPEQKTFFSGDFLSRTHYFALTPSILIEAVYPHHFIGKKLRRKLLLNSAEDKRKILIFNFMLSNMAYQYTYSTSKIELEAMNEMVGILRAEGKIGPKKPRPRSSK